MTQEEYEILKKTSLSGLNVVFYKKFSVNLSDMAYSEERSETIPNMPELPDLTEEEQEKVNQKLQEIRKNLNKKISIN